MPPLSTWCCQGLWDTSSCATSTPGLHWDKPKSSRADSGANPCVWLTCSELKVPQSCPTLCNPMEYMVHGILQARILEWVAFPFSRGSSQPRNQTWVSCIAGGFFTHWAIKEAQNWSKWCEINSSDEFTEISLFAHLFCYLPSVDILLYVVPLSSCRSNQNLINQDDFTKTIMRWY